MNERLRGDQIVALALLIANAILWANIYMRAMQGVLQ